MKVLKILFIIFIIFFIVWLLYSPTPLLHKAAKLKDIEKVRELINSDTNVNEIDRRGFTALHIASEFGTYEIVRLLLEYGADVNARTMYDVTPLHFAAQGGNIAIANLLISRGAIVNAEDDKGRTPLLWIIGKEYATRDMINLLELHEDANEIWNLVKSKEEYKKVVLMMRNMNINEFNNIHYIKRTRREIQVYLNRLINLR